VNDASFLKHITLGQYIYRDSAVHRLNPVTKLVTSFIFIGTVIAAGSVSGLVLALLFILTAVKTSRISLGYTLKGLIPVLPFLVLIVGIQVFFIPKHDSGMIWWQWRGLVLSGGDILIAGQTIVRFTALLSCLSLLSYTIQTRDLHHAVAALLSPLEKIGFPSQSLSLIFLISLRFVPVMAMEADRIVKAQSSRGAGFDRRRRHFLGRITSLIPIMVPLFISALRRTELLVTAMEARCFDPHRGRSRRRSFPMKRGDQVAVAVTLAVAALIISAGLTHCDHIFFFHLLD
jgi:energy-coupling factor transport system permease protein